MTMPSERADAAFLVQVPTTLKAEGELFILAPLLVAVLADFPEVQTMLGLLVTRLGGTP